MSAPPYMKLYVADYLADTTHLSRGEHGAYLLLLMAMWRAGGKLPADDAKLAAIAKCSPKEWGDVREAVLPFFQRRGGLLTHKRVTREIAKYEATSDQRSKAGKSSARKRASKNSDEGAAFVEQTESISSHNQNHNHNQNPPEAPVGGGVVAISKSDVEAIWAITPKASRQRSGKADLERTLSAAAKRGHPPDRVLAGLAAYFASDQATKDGGAFAKGVHRMIEGDRWESFAPATSVHDLFMAAPAEETHNPWPARVREYCRNIWWNSLDWGPAPGKPGCTVSAADLEAGGYTGKVVPFAKAAS